MVDDHRAPVAPDAAPHRRHLELVGGGARLRLDAGARHLLERGRVEAAVDEQGLGVLRRDGARAVAAVARRQGGDDGVRGHRRDQRVRGEVRGEAAGADLLVRHEPVTLGHGEGAGDVCRPPGRHDGGHGRVADDLPGLVQRCLRGGP